MSELALLGGQPVRSTPFAASGVIDEHERRLVNECLDRREFSRFIGSPAEDLSTLLVTPSAAVASDLTAYFSFLGGRMVRTFERDFAAVVGVDFAVSVNSATSGLSVALAALGCGPGDEVITTCMSFNATSLAILAFNSVPVFVDVSPENYCLDPELVRRAVTPRTKAILAVHLLGFPAAMDEIMEIAREHGLKVIEDCAQSPGVLYKGRPVGSIGHAGVFSFQETKNIMTGEGGMITTQDPEVARRCRLIRNHGESVPDETWDDASLSNLVGLNFRMTELTAALGVAQTAKLAANNAVRVENTRHLLAGLAGLPHLSLPDFPEGSVPHVIPLIYDEAAAGVARDDMLRALRAEGIPVGGGYLRLMPENPIFTRKIAYGSRGCPWTCHPDLARREYRVEDYPLAKRLISKDFIWFYHMFAPNGRPEMDDVIAAFHKVFGGIDQLRQGGFEKTRMGYKW